MKKLSVFEMFVLCDLWCERMTGKDVKEVSVD